MLNYISPSPGSSDPKTDSIRRPVVYVTGYGVSEADLRDVILELSLLKDFDYRMLHPFPHTDEEAPALSLHHRMLRNALAVIFVIRSPFPKEFYFARDMELPFCLAGRT